MFPVFCIIVLAGEVATIAAFLLIPDRGRWKRWAAGGLLAATVLLLAGVGGLLSVGENRRNFPERRGMPSGGGDDPERQTRRAGGGAPAGLAERNRQAGV